MHIGHECFKKKKKKPYYLIIKKNKIMPFAATWMKLKMVILSKVKSDREGET